ncbi:hypothetical protein, partial [Achromobacter xylosoxidans]|uniref:hypothetical protein n=1 Tax=Alcaligenes xylosoxydans xylosoxydans TaxID=85698 RepID=UPI001F1BF321
MKHSSWRNSIDPILELINAIYSSNSHAWVAVPILGRNVGSLIRRPAKGVPSQQRFSAARAAHYKEKTH